MNIDIKSNESIFSVSKEEVQNLAKKKFGKFLDEIELKEVQKRIEFGLECWEDVVIYAVVLCNISF